VLEAVDDLLVEQGYEAMTMKGIAERAGVGRQTIYRWWSTKAEILFEACVHDARRELSPGGTVVRGSVHAPDPARGADGLDAFRIRLAAFLSASDAGASYLALLAASRLDPEVADLMRDQDPVVAAARTALDAAGAPADDDVVASLLGPPVFRALTRAGPGISRRS
jgi:AcrR family transcriptional regulator